MNFHDLPRVRRDWIAEDLAQLSKKYAHIRRAVERVGVPHFTPRRADFHTLMALIVEQQISVKAARAILLRLESLMPEISAPALLALNETDMRAVGLSGQKVRYLRDLAQHVADGRLQLHKIKKLPDDEIVRQMIAVKGIGRWSVENFMLFALERRDVWPAGDIILQEGVRKIKGLPERPKPKEMDAIGARYAPHRSAMALLAWHYHEGTK